MTRRRRRPWSEYGVAVASVFVGWAAIRLLGATGYTGFAPLLAAVVVSAWYGGVGPGVVSVVLSSAWAFRFASRSPGMTTEPAEILRAGVFAGTAVLASGLNLLTRRARRVAERARAAAEEATAVKTRFLALVSHELRNPLGPVLMAVAVAEADPVVAGRIGEELATVRRNVALQVRLIDDLLDAARVASGKLTVAAEPTDLHVPAADAVHVCRDEFDRKRVELRVELVAPRHTVRGDAGRLEQVFWNLLRNAAKFTPAGGRVTLRTYDDGPSVAAEVADDGAGIDAGRLAGVFAPFEQGGADVTRRHGGLGLGLSICRATVEAHGGTVTAASGGPGRGSTFTVRLPVCVEGPAATGQASRPARISHATP